MMQIPSNRTAYWSYRVDSNKQHNILHDYNLHNIGGLVGTKWLQLCNDIWISILVLTHKQGYTIYYIL